VNRALFLDEPDDLRRRVSAGSRSACARGRPAGALLDPTVLLRSQLLEHIPRSRGSSAYSAFRQYFGMNTT
jgi:hypothetical protein